MHKRVLFKSFAVILTFVLSCPLPLSQNTVLSSVDSCCLAPGSLTDKSLVNNYKDVFSSTPKALLINNDSFFAGEPEAKKSLGQKIKSALKTRKAQLPSRVMASGKVVMNSEGAALFENTPVYESKMRVGLIEQYLKNFPTNAEYSNTYASGTRINHYERKGILTPLRSANSCYMTAMPYDDKLFAKIGSLVIPDCVVPFFCEPSAACVWAKESTPAFYATLFVKKKTMPIAQYIVENINSQEDKMRFYGELASTIKDFVHSPLGRVATFDLSSFEVDPESGKIYFAAVEEALLAYSLNAPRIKANVFGRSFNAELLDRLALVPERFRRNLRNLGDYFSGNPAVPVKDLFLEEDAFYQLYRVVQAIVESPFGDLVELDSGSFWVNDETGEILFKDMSALLSKALNNFGQFPAPSTVFLSNLEEIRFLRTAIRRTSVSLLESGRQGRTVFLLDYLMSLRDTNRLIDFVDKFTDALEELVRTGVYKFVEFSINSFPVQPGTGKIYFSELPSIMRQYLGQGEIAPMSDAEPVDGTLQYCRDIVTALSFARATKLPLVLRDKVVPLTRYLKNKYSDKIPDTDDIPEILADLSLVMERLSTMLLGTNFSFNLDDFVIDPTDGKIYFDAVDTALRSQVRDAGNNGSGKAYINSDFLAYCQEVIDADPSDILDVLDEYQKALNEAGPGGDSSKEDVWDYRDVKTGEREWVSDGVEPMTDEEWEEERMSPYKRYPQHDVPVGHKKVGHWEDETERKLVVVGNKMVVGPQDAAREKVHEEYAPKLEAMLGYSKSNIMNLVETGKLIVSDEAPTGETLRQFLPRERAKYLIETIREKDYWGLFKVVSDKDDIESYKFAAGHFYAAFADMVSRIEPMPEVLSAA